MANRTKAREQALQILYLIELANTPIDEAFRLFRANFENSEQDFDFASTLVKGVLQEIAMIDSLMEKYSENWKISRMSRIDRNILRLGTYELKYTRDVPPAVAMDEAVELGKKFGDSKSSAFINGILDQIFRQTQKGL